GDGTARLDDDDDAIGAAAQRRSERDDAPAANAREAVDRPLQILRMIFPPVDDDEILRAAADEELAPRQVSEVAGMQPPFPDGLRGHRVLLIVAQHYGGSVQKDFADPTFAKRPAIVTDDLESVARQRRPAAHERYRRA